MEHLEEQFRSVGADGKAYRGAPFWSWNDDLDPEELRRQVREMRAAGLGGFFMHARIGLVTPYLGDKWMECIAACIDEARQAGMDPWLYDEDCWPSGSAGGRVTAQGEAFRQKWLTWRECDPQEFKPGEGFIAAFSAVRDGKSLEYCQRVDPGSYDAAALAGKTILVFSYHVGGYADLLNRNAMRAFIDSTYEPYYERFGETTPGIFTDEPQYHAPPWTEELPGRFKEECGHDLIASLPALFFEVGEYREVRHDYWRTATRCFVDAFSRQIGEWCREHNWAFTGHYMAEDSLQSQVSRIGAAMPHYEYMQVPGIDHLMRRLGSIMLVKQVSSAAHQFGGRRVLSEMYGCSGWNASLQDLKWIGEWQFALGVDLPCQHLSLYSLRGCRKRDYPPSLHYQLPWWSEYRLLNDYFARLLFLLTQGRHAADVLLIHPIASAWCAFDAVDSSEMAAINSEFEAVSKALLGAHRDFDYGDEMLLERHARVEDGRLVVGTASYKAVVVPPALTLAQSTVDLLETFRAAGGLVVVIGRMPQRVDGAPSNLAASVLAGCTVVGWPTTALDPVLTAYGVPRRIAVLDPDGRPDARVLIQQRELDEGTLTFLANSDRDEGAELTVCLAGRGRVRRWDCASGSVENVPTQIQGANTLVKLALAPAGSCVLTLEPGAEDAASAATGALGATELPAQTIPLGDSWTLQREDLNAVTLDTARCRIDGGAEGEPRPVIHIQDELARLGRSADVELTYTLEIDGDPAEFGDVFAAIEVPEEQEILVNGTRVENAGTGWWIDIAFRKVPIGAQLRTGANTITLRRRFVAQAELAARINDQAVHESERNRLRYATELESIYVVGDFGVSQPEPGRFVLGAAPGSATTGDLGAQGLLFYAGAVVLEQTFEAPALAAGQRAVLDLGVPAAIVAEVLVNGESAGKVGWAPWEVDVTGRLRPGANTVAIRLTGSLRNLLGPHHHIAGEPIAVGPDTWRGRRTWTDTGKLPESTWTDEYHFVPFGLRAAPVVRVVGEQ